MCDKTKGDHLIKKSGILMKVNHPTAELWGIIEYKGKGTSSSYNSCHSFPQQAERYFGISFINNQLPEEGGDQDEKKRRD